MPVKYTREDADELAQWEAPRGGPQWRTRQPDPKKRLLMIYVGLFGAILLIAVGGKVQGPAALSGRPIQRGEGVVLEKIEEGGAPPVHALRIKVLAANDKRPVGEVAVSKETYERFAVGNRIGVLYQMNRFGNQVRIIETGLVVLPEPRR